MVQKFAGSLFTGATVIQNNIINATKMKYIMIPLIDLNAARKAGHGHADVDVDNRNTAICT
jgi:hypothetical protein